MPIKQYDYSHPKQGMPNPGLMEGASMTVIKRQLFVWIGFLIGVFGLIGCTVKAVGDPNRPITINAHITVDINGLKDTATDIEDYVSGSKSKDALQAK
jgi:hypothetical protein